MFDRSYAFLIDSGELWNYNCRCSLEEGQTYAEALEEKECETLTVHLKIGTRVLSQNTGIKLGVKLMKYYSLIFLLVLDPYTIHDRFLGAAWL